MPPKKIVVSQPMFFPWRGIFEQIREADVYVHYDDVQLPQGRSFISRVQIKTSAGVQWLTVPVSKKGKGKQPILQTEVDDTQAWRTNHLSTLAQNYNRAPYRREMLEMVTSVYALPTKSLAEINMNAIEKIAAYFGIECQFLRSSEFGFDTHSSEKLLQIVQVLDGDTYITGHGARNYLDHLSFEKNQIRVEYMDYKRTPYLQLFGDFEPHVTILDLIANAGMRGIEYIDSKTIYWRDFLRE